MQRAIKSRNKGLIRKDENVIEHTDVYFTHEYARLYEGKEEGETQTVYFENKAGKVEYTFLKRKVPFLVDNKQYYDITTAYGYGGPCIRDSKNSKQLLADFNEAFTEYCSEQNIISEFIRFHLFETEEVRTYFDGEVSLIGPHIVRDLKHPLNKNFHKDILSSVRKAERKGLTVTFDTTGEKLDNFLSIYNQTMDRNEATSFYYFDKPFFEELHDTLRGKFVYAHGVVEGEIVGSFSAIFSGRYAYGFLGGSLKEYWNYGTSAYLQYRIMEWLKEAGAEYFIIGGGYREKDSLYNYKKKFDLQGDYPFYIGKRIHNEEVYRKENELREAKGSFNPASDFFPLYRS